MIEEMLTVEEVGKKLLLSKRSVVSLINNGLPGYKIAGRWRVSKADLEMFLQKSRVVQGQDDEN